MKGSLVRKRSHSCKSSLAHWGFCLLLAMPICVVASQTRVANAQGDWDVKRSPFDRRVVARYKAILRRNPSDTSALRKLTQLYKRYRTISLLLREYEKALKKAPKRIDLAIVLGHLQAKQRKFAAAEQTYQTALTIDSKNLVALIALGDLFKKNNKPVLARKYYDRAIPLAVSAKQKKLLLREVAEFALAADDIVGAKGYFERYIALAPKDLRARMALADALTRHKRYPDAIKTLKETSSLVGKDVTRSVEIASRLGVIHEAKGDDAAAIKEYRRAISLAGKNQYLQREMTNRLIEVYRRRRELPALITKLEKRWANQNKRGHFEWDTLARLYDETGDQERAMQAYQTATNKAPYELATRRQLIALLDNAGRESEALTQYEKLVKIAPGEPRFQLQLAKRYKERGSEKKALAVLQKLSKRFPNDAGVQTNTAELYTRWGRHELALKSYTRLTRIEPKEPSHWVNLGEHYYIHGNQSKAIATWKRLLHTRSAAAYGRLAQTYAEHDMLKRANAMYAKSIAMQPKKTDWYIGRARVLARLQKWPEAITDWKQVFELTKNNPSTRGINRESQRRIVGLLLRTGTGPLRRQMAKWQTQFGKNPPDLDAGYFLVEAHLRQRSFPQARTILERILSINPSDIGSVEQLVKVYRSQRQYDKAVALLQGLIQKLGPKDPGSKRHYYTQIAEIKTEANQHEDALRFAHKALETGPQDATGYRQLGQRYEAMQRHKQAIEAYEKAIALNPRSLDIYFTLARLYKGKETKKAARLYHEVLKRARDEDMLHRAGREAINLEEISQTLDQLERVLAPLAFRFPHKVAYRKILVELYERHVPAIVARKNNGNAAQSKKAEKELAKISNNALKPLLEALNDKQDPSQQRIAVFVLGHLHHRGAAVPLVRFGKRSLQTKTRNPTQIGTQLNRDVRIHAIVAAGRLGEPKIIPELATLSKHRSIAVRQASVFALGLTKSALAIPSLLSHLSDSDQNVQTLACLGLAQIGEQRVSTVMAKVALDTSRHENTRSACTFGLGLLKAESATPQLALALEQGSNNVQKLAAWSLGMVGDKRMVPKLVQTVFRPHKEVRKAAVWALGQLTEPALNTLKTSNKLRAPRRRAGLDNLLREYPTHNGTFNAAAAVAQLPGPLPRTKLDAGLIVDYEKEITASILGALGRHRDVMLNILGDLNNANRPNNSNTSNNRANTISLGPITKHSQQTSQTKPVNAAIHRIATEISPHILKLTSHTDPEIRSLSVVVAARLPVRQVDEVLARSLKDTKLSVRLAAIGATAERLALSRRPVSELQTTLEAKRKARDWRERRAAVRALGTLRDIGRDEPVLEALADPNGWVREQAAIALGQLGKATSVPGLLKTTYDRSEAVQLAAVRSLVQIADPRAVSRLKQIKKHHRSAKIRAAAAQGTK